jgi:hypothetical protein
MGDRRARALTLTVRSRGEGLRELTDLLVQSFARFIRQDVWTDNVVGGAAFMEIKRGLGNRGWHPHFHIVTHGQWVKQAELSNGWEKATGGSVRVWVEQIRAKQGAVSYAAKYASKPLDATVFPRADWLDECVRDLRGRRLWRTVGEWRGRRMEGEAQDTSGFRTVGYLDDICRAARGGSVEGMNFLRMIGSAARVDEACAATYDNDLD